MRKDGLEVVKFAIEFLCFPSCGENVGKENRKTLVESTLRGFWVPGAGVEPAHPFGHWCLRPTRLPIPPSGHERHWLSVIDFCCKGCKDIAIC